MPEEPPARRVLDLLAQLCERQDELTTATQLAVMQAFNICEEFADGPCPSDVRAADSPVEGLLVEARSALEQAARASGQLTDHLRYVECQALIELATCAS